MELLVKRKWKKDTYTIGQLYIDGKYFCDTLEDKDRGLSDDMSVSDIMKQKRYGITAIPYGRYKVDMNTVSPKYQKRNAAYTRPYGHKMPRILNVKGYDGILIHPGNTANDTFGCLLVGKNTVVGKVMNSQATWKQLMDKLLKDKNNIWIKFTA